MHPLFKLAVSTGSDELVKLHIARGRDANAKDESGHPALALAIAGGRVPTVKILLDAGADPTQKDNDGIDAFELAQAKGQAEIICLLEAHRRLLKEADEMPHSGEVISDEPESAQYADWEEDCEGLPPEDDPEFLERAVSSQAKLSSFAFVAPEEAWDDVVAELPVFQPFTGTNDEVFLELRLRLERLITDPHCKMGSIEGCNELRT